MNDHVGENIKEEIKKIIDEVSTITKNLTVTKVDTLIDNAGFKKLKQTQKIRNAKRMYDVIDVEGNLNESYVCAKYLDKNSLSFYDRKKDYLQKLNDEENKNKRKPN